MLQSLAIAATTDGELVSPEETQEGEKSLLLVALRLQPLPMLSPEGTQMPEADALVQPLPSWLLHSPQRLTRVLGMFTLWLQRIFPPRGGLWEKAQKKCIKNPSNFPKGPWPLIC